MRCCKAIAQEIRSRLEALRLQRHTARAQTIAARAIIAAADREESLERARDAVPALHSRGQALAQLNSQG
jgi:hypothetical protein